MKFIYLFLLSAMLLHADSYTLKLYERILPAIFSASKIRVFADKESAQILKNSHYFLLTRKCDKNVDILLGSHFKHLSQECKNKPLFATTHRAYRNYTNAFGAFFWFKGRPQIHFRKDLLHKLHLEVPQKLQRFIDE